MAASNRTGSHSEAATPPAGRPRGAGGRLGQWLIGLDPPWIIREVLLAVAIGVVLLAIQVYADNRAADRADRAEEQRAQAAAEAEDRQAVRAERLENLRFVRSQARPGGQKSFAGLDLRKLDLQSLDFSGADLHDADLRGSDLTSADLRHARLDNARLDKATLEGADLRGGSILAVSLRNARVRYANLWRATLTGSDLRGADLRNTMLKASVLTEVKLGGAALGKRKAEERPCFDARTAWPNGSSFSLELTSLACRVSSYVELFRDRGGQQSVSRPDPPPSDSDSAWWS